MKLLSGADIAGYIKERQARQVRALVQAHGITPRLAVIQTKDDPVINTYVRLKINYGQDIMVGVESKLVSQADVLAAVESFNSDPLVHGIVVQLPLKDASQTETVLATLAPQKDVDGLGGHSQFAAATATAINWLLAGYGVDLANKKIVIVGQGRLVGQPLLQQWVKGGYDAIILDKQTKNLASELKTAEVIVSATGVPGLLTSDMIPIGAVVVDAGTASESGKIKGDVAPEVYERHDLTITPRIGGVGPLTVAALFDNVIRASQPR